MQTSSSAVILDNVDDYLAPSQACVNPLFQADSAPKKETPPKAAGAVVIPRRRRRVQVPSQPAVQPPKEIVDASKDPGTKLIKSSGSVSQAVKASIADCLACSGCVTTAETVLLEQTHSLQSLRERLQKQETGKRRLITLSPNSIADLCRHWKLPAGQSTLSKIASLLYKYLKADVVVDGNVPLQWTWHDEAQEFVETYKRRKMLPKSDKLAPPNPSVAIDAESTTIYEPDGTTRIEKRNFRSNNDNETSPLPLLSGSCPAIVCLVEKGPEYHAGLVPRLSAAVSPMTRVGMALKLGNPSPQESWEHWAVMPCHDKKLEASRKDFLLVLPTNEKVPAVDLVVTTTELVHLLEEMIDSSTNPDPDGHPPRPALDDLIRSMDPPKICYAPSNQPSTLPLLWSNGVNVSGDLPVLLTFEDTLMPCSEASEDSDEISSEQKAFASGGHANFIFMYAAQALFGLHLKQNDVYWEPVQESRSSNDSTVIKSARMARQQKRQQYYQACLYRSSSDGRPFSKPGPLQEKTDVVLRFEIARGMQTSQRALKRAQDPNGSTDYLEVMACPFGCVNGGGSVRTSHDSNTPKQSEIALIRETPTETANRVSQTIQRLETPRSRVPVTEEDSAAVPYRTRYHVVPPMQHTMGATAGVKVQDMLW
eukprot:Nitzschia sp. Nitz4//scaffold146_size56529//47438//49390//NITZ4_006581-RA/size56529-processed-gene-0.55-mRNA-1//1//CDS//3329536650//3862//frame0